MGMARKRESDLAWIAMRTAGIFLAAGTVHGRPRVAPISALHLDLDFDGARRDWQQSWLLRRTHVPACFHAAMS
ncbi:hypothetical protein NL676_002223 [Syzygium grande]|nr:hypothetical protein NL676_002223 [Syzygium grande]